MVKYNEVKETFEKHKCQLLMTEEEFNQKKRYVREKYKYIASCGDKHEVYFHHFKKKLSGGKCPKCVNLKLSIDKKEKYKLNPISMNDLEYNSIQYIKTIVGDTIDVKFNGEGCLADCCIKPKHITEDSWLMVQIKSATIPASGGYKFICSSKYTNCIIMCICLSDKKMWLLDGNKTTTKCISIGLKKSKYDEFEITKDTIHEKLTHNYNTFPKYDFETIDTLITPNQKLEREYRIYREKMIPCINFINNERQGLVYDFMINNFKIQEKVSSKNKNGNDTQFILNKSNSSNNGVQQHISYQQGDNDFYWLNLNNKQHFYIIPEDILISKNFINTDKRSGIYLNPNSKKGKNSWANEYLFDYTNITEIDIQKLKRMFHIE